MGKKTAARKLFSCLLLLGALAGYICWGNSALMTTEISVTLADLPEAFSGYRIAQISDLHNAQFGKDNERLLDILAQCRPDIIVLTGDLFDSNHPDLEVAALFAANAARIAPTYYVTGNHEGFARKEYAQLKPNLTEAGVHVLENRIVQLERSGETLSLVGLHDNWFTDVPETVSALVPSAGECTVLLAHRPEFADSYAEAGADLVLSGHVHGGQFRLPFIGGLLSPGIGFFPEYDSGLYKIGDTQLIVSRGLGNSRIPFRFNNRPEIVLAVLN